MRGGWLLTDNEKDRAGFDSALVDALLQFTYEYTTHPPASRAGREEGASRALPTFWARNLPPGLLDHVTTEGYTPAELCWVTASQRVRHGDQKSGCCCWCAPG